MNCFDQQYDDIECLRRLSGDMFRLYRSRETTHDVTFIIGGEKVFAHRNILATRLKPFEAMLYGGFLEARTEEIPIEANIKAFELLLMYIYTGQLDLDSIEAKTEKMETVIEILNLAEQYDVVGLKEKTLKHFEDKFSVENVVAILEYAHLFRYQSLAEKSLQFMDCYASEILNNESLLDLSLESLYALLKRDSILAPEIEIFRFINKWLECHPYEEAKAAEIYSFVRLQYINHDQLLDEVVPIEMIDGKTILRAMKEKRLLRFPVACRAEFGIFDPDKNIATAELGARVIKGENPDSLLIENESNNCTFHADDDSEGIIIELNQTYELNHIRMKLESEQENRNYSYRFETYLNLNKKNWKTVIDYSKYKCRSWQSLYFENHAVRYIRIVGTSKGLKISRFEAECDQNPPKVIDKIIQPTYNVATNENAVVIVNEMVYHQSVLLNEDEIYNENTGFISHDISHPITIQLAQPYYIKLIRLVLYSLDSRRYTLKIETSIDGDEWEKVIEESEWVAGSFELPLEPAKPVVFIRITGIRTSVHYDNQLRCVHFECPEREDSFSLL